MADSVQNPPIFHDGMNYQDWKKDLEVWKLFTSTANAKKGPRVYLSLNGKAKDIIREMVTLNEIGANDGLEKIITELDKHYQKDQVQRAYLELEDFEQFRRPKTMDMGSYISEFERKHNKIKEHDMNMPDGVLAYKLLHHASLQDSDINLIKATMKELTFLEMKTKLTNIFSDITKSVGIKTEPSVKLENTHYVNPSQDTYYLNRDRGRGRGYRGEGFRGRGQWNRGRGRGQWNNKPNPRKLNPPDQSGEPSKCAICQSIYHWARDCPHAHENQKESKPMMNSSEKAGEEEGSKTQNYTQYRPMFLNCEDEENRITLFKTDAVNREKDMKILMGEGLSSAIIDSGAPETVTGHTWIEDYISKLNDEEKKLVRKTKSERSYKFGNSPSVVARETMQIPVRIANNDVMLTTDVVDVEVPLLISKKALKKADAVIDFKEDTIEIFGNKENLLESSSGHYMIPVNDHVDSKVQPTKSYICALLVNEDNIMKKAMKLHRHFNHATKPRIKPLLENADVWSEEMSKAWTEIENTCKECKIFKKPLARPRVGFSWAKAFNDVIAMDLKDYTYKAKKYKLLHIVDHCTRFGQCARVSSKKKEEILKVLFEVWIQVFGPPTKVLTDNGGEFLNDEFLDMCDKMGINMKMTAAEAPWSNGLVERHNAVLSDSLNKTLEEIEDFDLALSWTVQAKNSLYNFHGFSPFVLVFGANPKIPSNIDCELPALENVTTSEILAKNLNAMHAARQAFIKSESAEKVKRALRHNVSGAVDTKYFSGDRVYIKRRKNDRWSGPGVVLGQDHQHIFVSIGGFFYRVHPCRIILAEEASQVIAKEVEDNEIKVSEDMDEIKMSLEEYNEENEQDQEEAGINIDGDAPPENRGDMRIEQEHVVPVQERRIRFPRIGIEIKYKTNDSDEWYQGQVESKVDQYENNQKFNIRSKDTEEVSQVDFKNEVLEWKHIVEDEATPVIYLCSDREKEKIKEAMELEIENWKKNQVFEEVVDVGQETISVKWVMKDKHKDGKVIHKARLVARGFEEFDRKRSDSPTCMKENVRIMLAISASKGWECGATDIRAAFLQGNPISREVFIRPPAEFRKPGIIWQLHRCVYGLQDASRMWYIKVKEELEKLGGQPVCVDPAFFYWKNNDEVCGVMTSHVDDFLHSGDQLFKKNVLDKLRRTFEISSESADVFAYLGINLSNLGDYLTLDQLDYIRELKPINLSENRKMNKDDELTEQERKEMRSKIGKLNWATTQTRPDIAFEVSRLASRVNKAKVYDLIEVNKLVKKVKSEEVVVKFPKLNNLQKCKLVIYADAGFANVEDCGSQGAHIIFLVDEENNSVPLSWSSTRIKRVARSTLTAETLALNDAVDKAQMINKILSQVILREGHKFPMICYTDSYSLAQSTQTSHTLAEKRLLVDMAALREAVDREEVKIVWIETRKNIANPLTKKTAYSGALIEVLRGGHL